MKESVLVIAAHPDDEVIGCGGTIAKHHDNGDEINTIIMAEGSTSRSPKRNREQFIEELSLLSKAAKESANILGIKEIEILDLPDNRLDSMDLLDIIKIIENKIKKFNPTIIYTHHSGDVNIDHRLINDAVIAAARPLPDSNIKRILSFEVASSTEWRPPDAQNIFIPNYFVSIENQFKRKIKALEAYECEMRDWPHPRSYEAIEYQAKYRGSQIGYKYAESFSLLREIS